MSSSSIREVSSLLRHIEAFRCHSAEKWADALPISFRACWADSSAFLGLRVPTGADSSMLTSGMAASWMYPFLPARLLSAVLAAGVILDWMVGSSLGTLVKGVSGVGCFLLMLFLFRGSRGGRRRPGQSWL